MKLQQASRTGRTILIVIGLLGFARVASAASSADPCIFHVVAESGGKPFQTGEQLWSALKARYPELSDEILESTQDEAGSQVSVSKASEIGAFTLVRVHKILVRVTHGQEWSCEFNAAAVTPLSCECPKVSK